MVVSYEHSIVSCHGDLWPHIPYWWANKCKAEALIEEFEQRKQLGRPGNAPEGPPRPPEGPPRPRGPPEADALSRSRRFLRHGD